MPAFGYLAQLLLHGLERRPRFAPGPRQAHREDRGEPAHGARQVDVGEERPRGRAPRGRPAACRARSSGRKASTKRGRAARRRRGSDRPPGPRCSSARVSSGVERHRDVPRRRDRVSLAPVLVVDRERMRVRVQRRRASTPTSWSTPPRQRARCEPLRPAPERGRLGRQADALPRGPAARTRSADPRGAPARTRRRRRGGGSRRAAAAGTAPRPKRTTRHSGPAREVEALLRLAARPPRSRRGSSSPSRAEVARSEDGRGAPASAQRPLPVPRRTREPHAERVVVALDRGHAPRSSRPAGTSACGSRSTAWLKW